MANDWTPTEADALPWGDTVEVRWPDGSTIKAKPTMMNGYVYWRDKVLYTGDLTEWRRIDDRE